MSVKFQGLLERWRPRPSQPGLLQSAADQLWTRPDVAEAWRRCRDVHHLPPGTLLFQDHLQDGIWQPLHGVALETDHYPLQPQGDLGQLAQLLATYLEETEVVILVSDPQATVMHVQTIGTEPNLALFLREGVCMAERFVGNNGIGTAALLGCPAMFQGSEHYAAELTACGTAGYPVLSPQGETLFVLGALSYRPEVIGGIKAFLSFAGAQLEAKLFRELPQGGWMFRLRQQDHGPSGLAEALLSEPMLAVGDDGVITAANHSALTLLRDMHMSPIIREPIGKILNAGLYALLGNTGKSQAAPSLRAADGRIFKIELVQAHRAPDDALPARTSAPTIIGHKPAETLQRTGANGVITGDAVLDPLLPRLLQMQERKIPILITGESGVGKNHLVSALHALGPRKDRPLIIINTAGIPRDLIQSELFGFRSGSFTGAHTKGSTGKVVAADRGVLFLNEIGDMPFELQASLLHLLESSEVIPIGGTKPIRVDIQVIAATNRSLQDEVRKGHFRQDLYYRLNGAEVCMPPLRARADKAWVFQTVLQSELKDLSDLPPKQLGPDVMRIFMRHPWPGNIRELRNVVRLVLTGAQTQTIEVTDLPTSFLDEMDIANAAAASQFLEDWAGDQKPMASPGPSLNEWELQAVRIALEQSRGNVSTAARSLGITRTTLYRKMLQYDLDPTAIRANMRRAGHAGEIDRK